MIIKEVAVSRKEIESKLSSMGDYVKMDYLQACLKKQLDFDTRRFVLTKLSLIYESRKLYLEAAKLIRVSADINITTESKLNDFLKSSELYIKGGNYGEADISVAKAMAIANEKQKLNIKMKIKDFYKLQAKELFQKDKRKHAVETYEKLLSLDLNLIERKEVQNILLGLYSKLGKIMDYDALKRDMNSPRNTKIFQKAPEPKDNVSLDEIINFD